jgi:uncharacterized protein (TIGR03663 family)
MPILHGPLRFYLTALMYVLFGDSDFTARLAPALMGTAMVALCWLLRGLLGRVAAFTAAGAARRRADVPLLQPLRREDIYIACITLALLAVVFRFLDRPRRHQPALIGGLLALSLRHQGVDVHHRLRGRHVLPGLAADPEQRRELLRRCASVGWEAWAWALAAFAAVFTILFTTFLTHPAGLWDGIHDGLDYWLGQQHVGRGGEPWASTSSCSSAWSGRCCCSARSAPVALASPTPLRVFLIWAFVLSLAVYSWASEKFAWLVMHPLLPLILLAGLGSR